MENNAQPKLAPGREAFKTTYTVAQEFIDRIKVANAEAMSIKGEFEKAMSALEQEANKKLEGPNAAIQQTFKDLCEKVGADPEASWCIQVAPETGDAFMVSQAELSEVMMQIGQRALQSAFLGEQESAKAVDEATEDKPDAGGQKAE